MKILFAAPENAFGGFLPLVRPELPKHEFEVSGRFAMDTLKGFDVLIPTMTTTTRERLEESDRLRLIQQCGAGIEMVDLEAAREMNIWVANVPTAVSGSADSVAEVGIYLMIGLARDFRVMRRNLANRKVGEPQGRALIGKLKQFVFQESSQKQKRIAGALTTIRFTALEGTDFMLALTRFHIRRA